MKLLFDANLSHRRVASVEGVFPGSPHVRQIDLQRASDEIIWSYARENGLTIVTLDSDFYELSLLRGFPPKIVRLRLGNTSTSAVAALMRPQAGRIADFDLDPGAACLILQADEA